VANEVVIKVVSRNEVGKGFQAARADITKFGEDSAKLYQDKFAERMNDLGRNLTTPLQKSGKEIGIRLGNSSAGEITRQISDHLTEHLPEVVSRGFTSGGGIALYRTAGETVGEEFGQSAGDRAGETMSERITDRITRRIKTSIRTVGDESSGDSAHAGERIGDDISKTIHMKIKEKIKTSVDVDTDGSIRSKAEHAGELIGDKVGDGVGGSLSSFFSGDLISLLVKAIAGGALVAALAPVIGAAITSAVLLGLGGGVLAAGIASAAKDPKIAGAFGDLKTKISGLFAEFGKPFRSPLLDFLVGPGGSGKGGLTGFIDGLIPKMKHLADVFAPIAGQLGTGLISLLQNAMPGIFKAIEASAPLFETLAKHMPAIGDAIGKFFGILSRHGGDANLLFGDLLSLIEKLIPFIAQLIDVLASAYSKVHNFVKNSIKLFNDLRDAWKTGVDVMKAGFFSLLLVAVDIFGKILAAASDALSWIPGIGPKLRAAQEKFNAFRNGVNNELKKITDRHVKVTITTYGLAAAQAAVAVAQTLKGMGYAHGGIKGAASGMVAGGLTWVGEQGPELVSLPTGSTVHSNGDSKRMASDMGGGGGGTWLLRAAPGASRDLMSVIIEGLRYEVDRNGQGSVQRFLGSPGVTA
jgi:hypothetical protein